MANIYDVNAAIEKPNIMGAYQQGMQFGQQQRALREQRADQQQLRSLAPQILSGDPGAFDQAASINPEAAKSYQSAGDDQLRRMKGAVDYIEQAQKSGNPQAVEAAYQQVRPYLARFGQEPPATFAEAEPKFQEAKARIAMMMSGQPGTGGMVQSTRVGKGDDGKFYYFTVDRNRNWHNSGVEADPRTQLRDQPGIAPSIVDLRGGTASPLSESQPMSGGNPPTGGVTHFDDQSPQQTQQMEAAIEAMHRAGASDEVINAYIDSVRSAPRGVSPAGVPVPMPSGPVPQPSGLTAPRPEIDAGERERLRIANDANQRAADAAAAAKRGNAPAGFRFKPDGSLEPIPGGPKPAGAAASEDERKAAAWLAQAGNAFSNMQSVLAQDERADDPGFIESYVPWDEAANRSRSDTRQQYVQAASSLSEALLRAATGAGITIDEAKQKVRELTPQRGDSDAVKAQKMGAIPVYIEALRQRAGRAAPKNEVPTTQGWSIQRVP